MGTKHTLKRQRESCDSSLSTTCPGGRRYCDLRALYKAAHREKRTRLAPVYSRLSPDFSLRTISFPWYKMCKIQKGDISSVRGTPVHLNTLPGTAEDSSLCGLNVNPPLSSTRLNIWAIQLPGLFWETVELLVCGAWLESGFLRQGCKTLGVHLRSASAFGLSASYRLTSM